MNSFYKHTHTHIYIYIYIYIYTHTHIHGQLCNSITVTDYFIANMKLPELSLLLRVYRGRDIGLDHFLTLVKLTFPPKWLHLPEINARKENKFHL